MQKQFRNKTNHSLIIGAAIYNISREARTRAIEAGDGIGVFGLRERKSSEFYGSEEKEAGSCPFEGVRSKRPYFRRQRRRCPICYHVRSSLSYFGPIKVRWKGRHRSQRELRGRLKSPAEAQKSLVNLVPPLNVRTLLPMILISEIRPTPPDSRRMIGFRPYLQQTRKPFLPLKAWCVGKALVAKYQFLIQRFMDVHSRPGASKVDAIAKLIVSAEDREAASTTVDGGQEHPPVTPAAVSSTIINRLRRPR